MLNRIKLERKVFKYLEEGRYDQALTLIELERLHAKKESIYYGLYGIVHIYMQRYEDAKMYISKALSLNSYDELSLNGQAYIYLLEGGVSEAIELYIRILDINSSNKLVKRNLNRFKNNKEVSLILSNLEPNKYLREVNWQLYKYQKSLATIFVIVLVLSFGWGIYNSLDKGQTKVMGVDEESGSEESELEASYALGSAYIKERLKYNKINYLSREQRDTKLEELSKEGDIRSRRIILNSLLSSNMSIEEKIELEHGMRELIYGYGKGEEDAIEYERVKDLFTQSYKYDDMKVVLYGNVVSVGDKEYIIEGEGDRRFRLVDEERILSKGILSKPVKLLLRINYSKQPKPYAEVLSVLD